MTTLNLEQFCKKFESDLNNYLTENLVQLKEVWHADFIGSTDNNSQGEAVNFDYLTDEILKYTIKSQTGGKRFRPYLVYLMAQPLSYEESLNYAIAVELLHSFALIHDDIMDRSELRRGQKSIFKFIEDKIDHQDKTHIAYSLAILVGDYIFSLAEGSFENRNQKINNAHHFTARKLFQTLKSEVILGQMLDIELGLKTNPPKNEILQKTYLKTANYSVSRPMQIGLSLHEIITDKPTDFQFCLDFGYNLGLAFQIQDDYLNLINDETITGKQQFSDLYEAKHTLASWHLKQQNNLTDFKDLKADAIKKILVSTGTLNYLKENIEEYYSKSLMIAQSTNYKFLLPLIEFLKNRNK
jgi:geranylgeranyl diphosphate synthase type I